MNNKLKEVMQKCNDITQGGCFKCQCTLEECIKNLYAVANGYDYDLVERMFNEFEDEFENNRR